jgi:hypothetical protein
MWFLNGKDPSTPYGIWQFDNNGRVMAPAAATPSGISDLAWASAIQRQVPMASLYASACVNGVWNQIRLFTSLTGGAPFQDQGPVLIADTTEPNGIGPAQVIFDPTDPVPFTIYYLARGINEIRAATSPDGQVFTRQGAVLKPSINEDSAGMSMSYAVRLDDGSYAIFYHGYYNNAANGASIVATSPTKLGPFGNKVVLLRPDGFGTTATASKGAATGSVPAGVTLPIGVPLLAGPATTQQEVIVAEQQSGTFVWFDRPFCNDHTADQLVSMAAAKVDLSYAQKQPDGTWKGIATLYGPGAGVSAEYTTSVHGADLVTPWSFSGDGLRFSPFFVGGRQSTENPAPLVSNASDTN